MQWTYSTLSPNLIIPRPKKQNKKCERERQKRRIRPTTHHRSFLGGKWWRAPIISVHLLNTPISHVGVPQVSACRVASPLLSLFNQHLPKHGFYCCTSRSQRHTHHPLSLFVLCFPFVFFFSSVSPPTAKERKKKERTGATFMNHPTTHTRKRAHEQTHAGLARKSASSRVCVDGICKGGFLHKSATDAPFRQKKNKKVWVLSLYSAVAAYHTHHTGRRSYFKH